MTETIVALSLPAAVSLGVILAGVVASHVSVAINQHQQARDIRQIRQALGLEWNNGSPPEPIFLRVKDAERMLVEANKEHERMNGEIIGVRKRVHEYGSVLTNHEGRISGLEHKGGT
jgi:hypothetical protein